MSKLRTIDDINVANKKVLVRVDFNVPIEDGNISSDARIKQAIPTIVELLKKGAKVILASHLGRPKGEKVPDLSLSIIEQTLRTNLPGVDISFVADVVGSAAKSAANKLAQGQVLLLENLRYEAGEETNDLGLATKLAGLADIYVDDAFSCAHRSHASIQAVAELLPSVAGRLMEKEIGILSRVLETPKLPLAAIIGGSKISSKLGVLKNLATKVQYLIIGGAMANTFLHAKGHNVGTSLCEVEMTEVVNEILVSASNHDCKVVIPIDVVVAKALEANIETENVMVEQVPQEKMILDVGHGSIKKLGEICKICRTVIWNGPLGAFEVSPFDVGTIAVAEIVVEFTRAGKLMSVVGGGDTVAALERVGAEHAFTYTTMAGGAFLEWLEGRILPGVKVLED
ncbi:uncharacterized protein METZ01_LOCUS202180 [marine metagenome]|uniref:phosphoglycerate kinase n=1 Tax=marine metagenome TaxID=408172 RepID=A0A382EEV9_9ZZZZ